MATAADWMSAASFISMAGIIAFAGYDGAVYLMGWTGGYVLLALLLAPYLRKFGKFTVPDFIGDRYYSNTARIVAVICALLVSFTYVAGQMRGVGIVFSRFLISSERFFKALSCSSNSASTSVFVLSIVFNISSFVGFLKTRSWNREGPYFRVTHTHTCPAYSCNQMFRFACEKSPFLILRSKSV